MKIADTCEVSVPTLAMEENMKCMTLTVLCCLAIGCYAEAMDKDRRINYCRRFWSIVVVYAVWMLSETGDFCSGEEAKDGVCVSEAVRTAR
jgi:hypothetical protein